MTKTILNLFGLFMLLKLFAWVCPNYTDILLKNLSHKVSKGFTSTYELSRSLNR